MPQRPSRDLCLVEKREAIRGLSSLFVRPCRPPFRKTPGPSFARRISTNSALGRQCSPAFRPATETFFHRPSALPHAPGIVEMHGPEVGGTCNGSLGSHSFPAVITANRPHSPRTLAVELSPGENRATPPFKPAVSPPESQAGSSGSLPPKRPLGCAMGSKAQLADAAWGRSPCLCGSRSRTVGVTGREG